MIHKSIIERAAASLVNQADSQPRQNDAAVPGVPQWCLELEEAWKACREQLERRKAAAGMQ